MPLPFRQRIFAILVALTAVPTALAVVGWALAVRTVAPSAGARVALEEVAASARLMVDRMDTTHLSARERAAFREHLEQLSNRGTRAGGAETYLRYYAGGCAAVGFVLGAFAVIAAVREAGHLSRQLSRPIDELVGWTRLIRRRMPLPAGPPTRGAPEFEALRQALRELATTLDAARERELEAERLRAFREVARRGAHEIKNPLTAMRIAVDQLRRSGGPVERRTDVAVEVIGAETERLDQLAKEFAEFGRLPEGPRSEVDLVDLLMDLGKSAVPSEVDVSVRANGEPCKLLGHYDPLRRAFANLLRNAAEAMGGRGSIEIAVSRDGAGLAVTIADHGAGIPDDLRQRVFEPYFTTKHDGTGLGLALVLQTIEAHNGSITVADPAAGPGGDDEVRQGEHRRRGPTYQAGRVSVPRKTADAGGPAHHAAGRARAVPHAGREPAAARSAGARRPARGREQGDGAVARADRTGRAHRGARLDHRGVGDRQGARRLRHPSPERARGETVRVREQRGDSEGLGRVGDVRPRARCLHGRHGATGGAVRARGLGHLVSRRGGRSQPRSPSEVAARARIGCDR